MAKGYVLVVGMINWDSGFKKNDKNGFKLKEIYSQPGGKLINQSLALAKNGENVKILSVVGNDKKSKKCLKILKKNKIDTNFVKTIHNLKCDYSKVFIGKNGENKIEKCVNSFNFFTKDLIDENLELIKNAKMVVSFAKLPKEFYFYLFSVCKIYGVKFAFTPCPFEKLSVKNEKDFEFLKSIDYIFANKEEAIGLFGFEDLKEILKLLKNLIITDGCCGVWFRLKNKIINIDAIKPKKIKDTTGAGDVFCGVVLSELLNKKTKIQAVKSGVIASTLKIGYYGASSHIPTKTEIEKFKIKNILN